MTSQDGDERKFVLGAELNPNNSFVTMSLCDIQTGKMDFGGDLFISSNFLCIGCQNMQ